MKTQKNILSYLLIMIFSISMAMAQVPEAINYQGVLRDDNGDVQANQTVDVRLTILSSGTAEFDETYSGITTNDFGLINLQIGTQNSSDFSSIDWSTGTKELQVEVDAGSGFEDLGTNELLSVPYALRAGDASGTWSENLNDLYYENGNVGIGTSSPSINHKLHLFDNGNTADLRIEDDYPFIDFFMTDPNGNTGLSFSDDNSDYVGWISYNSSQDGLKLSGVSSAFATDQLFLASDGNIGVNTISPEEALHIKQSGANTGLWIEHQSDSDYWGIGIGNNTKNFKFYYDGFATTADISSVDGSYNALSDSSLKKKINAMNPVMNKVMQMKPSTYIFKHDKNENEKVGFISQEIEKLFPQLVRESDEGLKLLNYSNISVIAIKAIQEQQATIETLQQELNAMKAEMQKLKNK